MISDRELAAAISARKPEGARRFEIAETEHGWSVTTTGGPVGLGATCVTEIAPGLATALAAAEVNFRRALIVDRNRAGVALAYSQDWSATA